MRASKDGGRDELLNQVAARIRRRAGKAAAARAEAFARCYYAQVPPRDLLGREAGDLAGAALGFFRFAATRKPGETRIRVFHPDPKTDGWKSDHTVIELVTDNGPFLVDSVAAGLAERGLTVHMIIHPTLAVRRDAKGRLKDFPDAPGDGVGEEAYIGCKVAPLADQAAMDALAAALRRVLADVHAAVEDWAPARQKVRETISELKLRHSETGSGELAEAQEFLQWLHDDHFTFLGYREYAFTGSGAKARVRIVKGSGLGVLRNSGALVFEDLLPGRPVPDSVKGFLSRPDPLVVSKADRRATVHRPVYLDVISVKRHGAGGKVTGERLIVGLFTSIAYNDLPRDIPLLRSKLDRAMARTGFSPASHHGKVLKNILETYPRDELFQIEDNDLLEIGMGILHLQERPRVALFSRHDAFGRFVSCLLFVPKDRFSTDLRLELQRILGDAYDGRVVAFNTLIGDAPLARLHLIVATKTGARRRREVSAIEARLAAATRSWEDHLADALVAAVGVEEGGRLTKRYGNAFAASYMENFIAQEAVGDIVELERAIESGDLCLNLYRPADSEPDAFRFKIYHPHRPLPLSDVLPVLEHMGLKVIEEVPHAVRPSDAGMDLVMIHDFGLVSRDGSAVDLARYRDIFQEAFERVWHGDMESDGFNALVLGAGLAWREVVILRAFAAYLRQAAIPYPREYMAQTLTCNPGLARLVVELFLARFDPAGARASKRRAGTIARRIRSALEAVESADEDRIIRRFVNLAEQTLRTNYFQPVEDGGPKPYFAVKLDSTGIDELPLPRPMREIFVYSPRFEAVHLRGGLVARGGLRWSDRPEDFRTEILGLMKAQMVKNAVIVPVGSKGGFVVKRPPPEGGREAFQAEGVACYKMFISGLLDITDNLAGGALVPPTGVVRQDGDDPYLVVAADKGTATFSDIANGVSADYDFWLGDAFASGGSVGYDHKKMGITAKGAWESVKRHFREIGTDIQKEPFTVVGVGDMGGDVFGNAMLLSKQIKLIAAFNHLHIFIDPDPDPAKSFAERRRLFRLPRSAWTDYAPELISKGGAIFERRAKTIRLSREIRDLFGIEKETVTPDELIRALLRAEADLLWFGGIGTFVKASEESHADAGDRASDALRVDARALRCKVVGEGANLGFTQLGRIEFALAGGRMNTDSVDNSAGVDCSDHEVNIKILLDQAVAQGKLAKPGRDKLLEEMTDEVAGLVLRDNYLQTQAITLVNSNDLLLLDMHSRFMRMLERAGRLNRTVEFLPDEETLAERERVRIGLTRPEISVVMPYAKLWLHDEILASDLPDDPLLVHDLIDYFPTPLRAKYRAEIVKHRLSREIISTVVTNSMINRVGGTFVVNLTEKTGARPADVARAYIATRDAFALESVWDGIEALDNKASAEMQLTLLLNVNQLIERAVLWFLRNGGQPFDIAANIRRYQPGIQTLAGKVHQLVPAEVTDLVEFRVRRYRDAGVPEVLARRVAYLRLLVSAMDIVGTASASGIGVELAARLYFAIGEIFAFGWLRFSAEKMPADSHWQKLAQAAVIEELYSHQRGVTLKVMNAAGRREKANALALFEKRNPEIMTQMRAMLGELKNAEQVDLSMLAVASRHMAALAG